MKLTIFSLRPMSAASILLLLVAFLAWPSANRVVAASIPDKINLAGNNGADWKNAIPSNGELARSARIAALMYQVSAVPCTSRLKLDGGSSMINHPGCRLPYPSTYNLLQPDRLERFHRLDVQQRNTAPNSLLQKSKGCRGSGGCLPSRRDNPCGLSWY